jgi:hypothetical protein
MKSGRGAVTHHNAERGPWLKPGLEQRLIALHAERLSYREIAEILSMEVHHPITRNAIIGKVHRLGLEYREKPPKVTPKPRKRRAQMRPPKPRPEPIPPPQIVPIENVTLFDLNDDVCHWPYGEHPAILFCGRPVYLRSYCADHYDQAYVVPKARWA